MSDLGEGDVVDGKYRIGRRIGEGGMGALYVAEHLFLKKAFALKLLHPELARQPDAAERFQREARAASAVEHPNVVRVSDFGHASDGRLYLVMELLQGRSLFEELEVTPRLSPARARFVACEMLRGLEAAHAGGVVHRDLKPENVFLSRQRDGSDLIKIVDFGIAKLYSDGDAEARLTKSGAVMGTPLYMAPEQVRGALDVDARTDLYATGVMLYEMLGGHTPFEGSSFGQIAHAILEGKPRPLHEVAATVDPTLSALVMKSFDRERARRFQSAAEMRAALERHRAEEPLATAPSPYATPRLSQLADIPSADGSTLPSRRRAAAAAPPFDEGATLSPAARGGRTRADEPLPPGRDAATFAEAEPIALELDRSPPPAEPAPAPRPSGAWRTWAVVATLAVAGGAAALVFTGGPSTPAATTGAEPAERVHVRIVDLPRGARVFLDGAPSDTSFTVAGARTERRLRFDAAGYATKVMLFTPDVDQVIDGRMTRSR